MHCTEFRSDFAVFIEKYQNAKTDEIYAYFSLVDTGENTWILEPCITSRFASYITDVIEFANTILAKRNSDYSLKLILLQMSVTTSDVAVAVNARNGALGIIFLIFLILLF